MATKRIGAKQQNGIGITGDGAPFDESVIITPGDGEDSARDGNSAERANNDDGGTDDFIDPAAAVASGAGTGDSGASKKRGRGRPAGSGKKRKQPSQASGNLDRLLFSIHAMGAHFLNMEELQLSADEAGELAAAINAVTELYEVPIMDEKTLAWVQLSMVAASIYGPRILVNRQKSKSRSGKVTVITPTAEHVARQGVAL